MICLKMEQFLFEQWSPTIGEEYCSCQLIVALAPRRSSLHSATISSWQKRFMHMTSDQPAFHQYAMAPLVDCRLFERTTIHLSSNFTHPIAIWFFTRARVITAYNGSNSTLHGQMMVSSVATISWLHQAWMDKLHTTVSRLASLSPLDSTESPTQDEITKQRLMIPRQSFTTILQWFLKVYKCRQGYFKATIFPSREAFTRLVFITRLLRKSFQKTTAGKGNRQQTLQYPSPCTCFSTL